MEHTDCAKYMVDAIEKYYYKPLEKKRHKSIQKMLEGNNMKDSFVFKPEYFNYLLFFQIYKISNHWTHHQFIPLFIHIHSFYITYLIQTECEKRYQYQSPFDTTFIKEIAFYLSSKSDKNKLININKAIAIKTNFAKTNILFQI